MNILFSVNEEEGAIHVHKDREHGSTQGSDCLVSSKEYSHYVLKLEYQWMESRFQPRVDWDRDAGLLFHVHGDLTRVWPLSLEMQIGESKGYKPAGRGPKGRFHTGDLFVLGPDLLTDVPEHPDQGAPTGEVAFPVIHRMKRSIERGEEFVA